MQATATRKQSARRVWERISSAFISTIANQSTRERMQRDLMAFSRVAGGRLTSRSVATFAAHLQTTRKSGVSGIRTIRQAVDHAVNMGILDRNPIDKWPKLEEPAAVPREITAAEESGLMAAAEDHRFRTFMQLSIVTAGHYHELTDLTWKQIGRADLDNASVMFPGTQQHRARRVPITRDLAETLDRMQRHSFDAGPFTYWNKPHVEKRFVKAAKAAGLQGLRIDDLCRTRVCRWLRSGLSAEAVAELAGMSLPAVKGYRRVLKGGTR